MTDEERNVFKEWDLILRNVCNFVQLEKIDGIKFEIRTKEKGHNKPHIHVSTSSASMSVAIDDGEILKCTGKISNSQKKMATKWVVENHDLLVKYWNELTDGVKIAV